MISSRKYMVSGLPFKSLKHFELIFVCGVRFGSSFILLHLKIYRGMHQNYPNDSK